MDKPENPPKHMKVEAAPVTSKEQRLPKRARRIGFVVVALVVAVFCVEGVTVLQKAPIWPLSSVWVTNQNHEVELKNGEGASALATSLFDAHAIASAPAFVEALRTAGIDTHLLPGTYDFFAGATTDDIIAQLIAGPNSQKGRLTVPEGQTVAETAATVEEALGISKESFMESAKASRFVDEFSFLESAQNDSLEGFLFGSTYDFVGENPSADDVLRAMLGRFQDEVAGLEFDAATTALQERYGLTFSRYDFIKMASILEKEGKVESDYANIASVFYNRMQANMMLQSDATRSYELGHPASADELLEDTPFNTYTELGLPPTPICSPSLTCIKAALAPAETKDYYFVIFEKDGYSTHIFSETYDEHLAAIAKVNAEAGAGL